MKIKKGDTVEVLSGNDKGKKGEVLEVIPKKDKIVVKELADNIETYGLEMKEVVCVK